MSGENKKTILLVEDEAIIAMTEKIYLEKYGYSVITVQTGEQAIETVGKTPGIDLMLMDIDLGKGIDGTQTAEIILKDHDLPLVFLSSHIEPDIVGKTEKITSYGYVVKNSGIVVLDASIKMAFKLFEEKLKVQKHQLELESINIKLSITNEQLEETHQEIINREEALKETQRNLSAVLNYTNENILSIDRDYNVLTINTAGLEEFKRVMNAKLTIGKNILDQIPEELRSQWKERYDRAFAGEHVKELVVLPRGDITYYAELTINPIYRKGEIVGAGIFSRDLTERKLAEDAINRIHAELKETTELLERTGEMAKVGGWELDLLTDEVTYSKETARIHGIDYPCVPPKLSQGKQYYPPETWPIVQAAVQAAIEYGTNYDHEWPFITEKGKHIWVRVQGFAVRENGKTVTLRGTFQDITERKHAEEVLRLNEDRLRLATAAGNVGIWDWDIKNDILVWDDSMYRLYGIRKEDFGVVYEAWKSMVPSGDREFADGEIQAAIRGEREYDIEHRIVRPDGAVRVIAVSSQTIRDMDGAAIRMIGTNIDITERKRAEETLRELRQ